MAFRDSVQDDAWKAWLAGACPSLGGVNRFFIIGPTSTTYNCFAYCMGRTDLGLEWSFPVGGGGLEAAMAQYGFTKLNSHDAVAVGDVEVWANARTYTHATKLRDPYYAESKMSAGYVILHERNGLTDAYGHVDSRWRKTKAAINPKAPDTKPVPVKPGLPPLGGVKSAAPTKVPAAAKPAPPQGGTAPTGSKQAPAKTVPVKTAPGKPAPTKTVPVKAPPAKGPPTKVPPPKVATKAKLSMAGKKLALASQAIAAPVMGPEDEVPEVDTAAADGVKEMHGILKEAYPDYAAKFDELFENWKATWHTGKNQLSSVSRDRAEGPEWDALVKQGAKVLPLLVQKLLDPENYFGILLYEELEDDDRVKVNPENVIDHTVMQRRANLIVEMTHHRNQIAKDATDAWKAHKEELKGSENPSDHVLSGEGHEALVDLGRGAIGPVMAEYAKEMDGHWQHVLYHALHGEKPSLEGEIEEKKVFEEWKEWFEKKERGETPRLA